MASCASKEVKTLGLTTGRTYTRLPKEANTKGSWIKRFQTCEYRQRQTLKHVLLDCRLWNAERQELRTAREDKSQCGDMRYLLEHNLGEIH